MTTREKLQRIFTSCGCNVFCDEFGVLTSSPLRGYGGSDPDWTIEDGPLSNLLALQRQMERTGQTANWIVVTGEHAGNTNFIPTGVAYDNDASSPTWVGGKFGVIYSHVQSTTVTTSLDAQVMAQHILDEGLGIAELVIATIMPNPAMQVDDLVRVTRAESKMDGVDIVMDEVSTPLVPIRGSEVVTRRRALPA